MSNQWEQMNLFDSMGPPAKPGDIVHSHGKLLEWKELEKLVGGLVVLDKSTQSREVLQVVRVERICLNAEGRKRLIFSTGGRQPQAVDKIYITTRWHPVRFYEI